MSPRLRRILTTARIAALALGLPLLLWWLAREAALARDQGDRRGEGGALHQPYDHVRQPDRAGDAVPYALFGLLDRGELDRYRNLNHFTRGSAEPDDTRRNDPARLPTARKPRARFGDDERAVDGDGPRVAERDRPLVRTRGCLDDRVVEPDRRGEQRQVDVDALDEHGIGRDRDLVDVDASSAADVDHLGIRFLDKEFAERTRDRNVIAGF